jgi:hypothetical protein
MISASGTCLPSMLRQPGPELGPRSRFERMSADAHDSGTATGVGTILAILHEEINTPLRPEHLSGTLRESTRSANVLLQRGEQGIKQP